MPGLSVHLPDFLSIRHVGRAIGDTSWMGAGLAGAGTKAEKTRQLSCAWRPLALVPLMPRIGCGRGCGPGPGRRGNVSL